VYALRMAMADFSKSEAASILAGKTSVFQTFEFEAEPGFFEDAHL